SQPRIGDIRISYQLTPAGAVSIVGRQTGGDFTEDQTNAGDRLLMVRAGTLSAARMFKEAARENTIPTWVFRAVGALFLYLWVMLILGRLVGVADFVPLIGSVLGAGASIVSLALTAVIAPVVIAIAWFWYRPLVSIIVITIGLGIAYGLHRMAGRKAAAAKPAPAPA